MRRVTAALLLVSSFFLPDVASPRPARPSLVDRNVFGLDPVHTAAVASNPQCLGLAPTTSPGGYPVPVPAGEASRGRIVDPDLLPPDGVEPLLQPPTGPQRSASHGDFTLSICGQQLIMAGPAREAEVSLFAIFGSSKPFVGHFDARVIWDPFAERFLLAVLARPDLSTPGSLWLLVSDDADPFGRWFGGRVGVHGPTRGLSHVAVSESLFAAVGEPEAQEPPPYWIIRGRESRALHDETSLRVELFGCAVDR